MPFGRQTHTALAGPFVLPMLRTQALNTGATKGLLERLGPLRPHPHPHPAAWSAFARLATGTATA